MTAEDLADLIRHRLESLGITATELASCHGTNPEAIRRWRSGIDLAGHAQFLTVLETLGVTLQVRPTKSWAKPLTRT